MFPMSRSIWQVAGATLALLVATNAVPAQSVRPVGSSYSTTGIRPWSDNYSGGRSARPVGIVTYPATSYTPAAVNTAPVVGNGFVSTHENGQTTTPVAVPTAPARGTPVSATTCGGCCPNCH